MTSLNMAAYSGHDDVVAVLLSHGADVNQAANDGNTPVYCATINGYNITVILLLNNGADPNKANSDGTTPLQNAARRGHHSIVSILLSNAANINQANNDGSSPLHFAAENGHDAVVAIFIEKGADVNQIDSDGDRPIDVAKTQKIKDMLIALTEEKQESQAVLKAVDEAQWFRAAKKGKLALIQQGINDKIDVNCRDSTGRSALSWSANHGHLLLVEYLIKNHAEVNILTVCAIDIIVRKPSNTT